MKTFDVNSLQAFPTQEKEKNVFYKADEFRMRTIELAMNQELPECEMKSHVVFILVYGKVEVTVDRELATLTDGKILVSEPATFAMKALEDSLIVGIQINKGAK